MASPAAPLGCRSCACHANGAGPVRGEPAKLLFHRDAGGTKIGDRFLAHVLRISRQHDRGLDRAAMNAVTQFFRRKQSIRRAEARPARGDREKPVLRAQILRDQHHRGAVAAMARHHDELPDAGARDALRRAPSSSSARPRSAASACPDSRYARWKCRPAGSAGTWRECWRAAVRAPAPDRPRRSDVGFERQMRAVLLGRRQRQHRDPARRIGSGDIGPVDVGPVTGRNG